MNVFIIRNLDPIDDLTISMVPNRLLSRLQLGWGGGNFRTSGFLPGISIYYNPPVYKFGKIISGVFQNLPNSCSFEPNIDFFLGIFHGPPFIITPRYGRNFQPPSFSIPPPTITVGRVERG